MTDGTSIVSGVCATALPEEALPAGSADVSRAEMKFWHASVAKNGAHLFGSAWDNCKPPCWLCNLDCDNITPPEFMTQVSAAIGNFEKDGMQWPIVHCKGIGGGLTGRLCYRAADFARLGGYEQRMPPTAGQDNDLRDRIITEGKKTQQGRPRCSWELNIGDVNTGGIELPNDFNGTGSGHQKNTAKTKNIDPAWFDEPGTDRKSWGEDLN